MNRTDAKKIAETITFEQLSNMFERAKNGIVDWEEVSSVNKGMTKGMAWNILYRGLDKGMTHRSLGIKNMIWEFGDYLDPELKPKKKVKREAVKAHHQDPVF